MEEKCLIQYYMNENNTLNLKAIVDDYTNYIFTIIKNITKEMITNEDIEELISDVFLVLWKNKNKMNPNMALKPYIAGITKNVIKNKLRTNKMICDFELAEEISENIDINEDLETKEKFEIISKELEKFGDDKKIFIMFYYQGKKTKEIAKLLGYTEFNVSTKLHRIKKKLKEALENRGYRYGR